jgi:hypothetical protein
MNGFRSYKLILVAALGALVLGSAASLALADGGGHRAEKRHGHHHRHHHRQPSGTIQSFAPETGRLTIVLFNEETVSSLVTDGTKIRCEDEHSPDVSEMRKHLRHGEAEPGDDHGGQGEEEPGDDHGDRGEVGDDHDGDNSGPGSSHSGGGPSGHDDNGAGANCTTSDLIVGAVVTDAELEIEHDGLVFDEVELAG